jgi:hypothetical protein
MVFKICTYSRRKIGEQIGNFVYKENGNFFAENWPTSPKIAIITLTLGGRQYFRRNTFQNRQK